MCAMGVSPQLRIIGDSLGVVHRRFEDNDPPVVGTQVLSNDAEHGVEVRFLLPTEADVARVADGGMLRRLTDAFGDALQLHGPTAPEIEDVLVSVSSLEGQGIRVRPGETSDN
jgi:hypothetical protein